MSSSEKKDGGAVPGQKEGREPRLVYLNDSSKNQELIQSRRYTKNTIVTSKYSVISFVPKTIFEFFRVVANIYFLLISLLQLATPWSPTNQYTTAGPLVFVLIVTMIKQGAEDLKRHQADEKQNSRTCNIFNDRGEIESITWQNLQVGQILRIGNNEELPADIVLLATSEEEARCFIETCNLDGETNLKRRIALTPTAKIAGWREINAPMLEESVVGNGILKLRGFMEYEQPNNQLYNFTGRLSYQDETTHETKTCAVGPENIMLRGCGLRSCSFVFGLVIFTGKETKLLQNSRAAPSKQSKLYKTANRCMFLIFTTMFCLCLVSAIVASFWSKQNDQKLWYLPFVQANTVIDFIVNFFTFLILYNNLVPISLYVSLDIIKVLQAKNITMDHELEHEGFRAISRTSELNEELGQVEYIFSDKTGTLTCNVMEFRKCSIGGIAYGFGTTEIGRAVQQLGADTFNGSRSKSISGISRTGAGAGAGAGSVRTDSIRGASTSTGLPDMIGPGVGIAGNKMMSNTNLLARLNEVNVHVDATEDVSKIQPDPKAAQVHYDPSIHFDDPRLLQHLEQGGPQSERIHEFLTVLSVCHTVIPEIDKKTGQILYRASSPDEEALVKAAKCLGYDFKEPAPITKIEILSKQNQQANENNPIKKKYMILNVNEFNSTRKRMSIVVFNEQSEYVLYCKGADNMMLSRSTLAFDPKDEKHLSEQDKKQKQTEMEKILDHLQLFASEGLRTLVLGKKILTEEEYITYQKKYQQASTSLVNRQEMLDEAAEMIETKMEIVGVTAIEDKLQEGVPITIADLAKAGIKIWVLTGDREETAINIGYACRLINESMNLLYVNEERIDDLEKQLDELNNIEAIQQLREQGLVAEDLAMICDGKALVHLFPSKDTLALMTPTQAQRAKNLATKLLRVATVCKALIACRVSPSQKAEIVNLVRKNSPDADLVELDEQGKPKPLSTKKATDNNNNNKKKKPVVFKRPITLAIGDGANDVSMIQTAHVGIGICGKEGVQAVNASDYAIAQFRFLKKLLLIHGRFNYKRICKVILYSFHKNIALVISLFLFNFFNGQSGSPLYESFVMAGWNFFLATPIMVIGIFDQDLNDQVVMNNPQLYMSSQNDCDLNFKVFTRTIGNSILHALITFWICYGTLLSAGMKTNSRHGGWEEGGLFLIGTVFYSGLLMTMTLKVTLQTKSWNKYHLVFLGFSFCLFFMFLIIYPFLTFLSMDMYGVTKIMFAQDSYWYLFFLCPVASILTDYTLMTIQQQYFPTPEDILLEQQIVAIQKARAMSRTTVVDSSTAVPGTTTFKKMMDGITGENHAKKNALVIPRTPIVSPRTSVTDVSIQPRLSTTSQEMIPCVKDLSSFNGFAFNGPDKTPTMNKGEKDMQELVTMRVQTFNDGRLQSYRRTSLTTIMGTFEDKENNGGMKTKKK